jgi:maleylacetoacetate isomerase
MTNKLYDYYRSSCSYRVRIALNLKKISYEKINISLIEHKHHESTYTFINPQGAVPTWEDEHIQLTQSLAILEYLDEQYPHTTPILPKSPLLRARARQFSQIIACDIHPLNNLRVKEYLKDDGWSDKKFLNWYHHWLTEGFNGFEQLLVKFQQDGPYCLGTHISIADICLVPQIYNAFRFSFDMTEYPHIMNIYRQCQQLPAFIDAEPKESA